MYRSFTAEEYKNDFGLAPDYKVDAVLCYGTVYDEKILRILCERLGDLGDNITPKNFSDPSLKFVHEININNKTIWFITGYGSAYMSACLHLACLFGSQKNILIGSCGGLKPGIKSGDFIIPTDSFSQDTTATMYNRDTLNHVADETLSNSVEQRLDHDIQIWRGPTTTCQASLAQTENDVNKWSNDGYLGVEMEVASVFAVSRHFSVPAAAIIYVADNLIENQTHLSESYKEQADMRKDRQHHQIKVALEELIS